MNDDHVAYYESVNDHAAYYESLNDHTAYYESLNDHAAYYTTPLSYTKGVKVHLLFHLILLRYVWCYNFNTF